MQPLDTLAELMDALVEKWGDSSSRVLHHYPGDSSVWITTEGRHMSFSTMILPVDPAVVAEAKERGWIEGKKEWGGRSRCELVVSERGEKSYWEARGVIKFLGEIRSGDLFWERFWDLDLEYRKSA